MWVPIVGALVVGPMLIIGVTLAEFATAERINPTLNRYPLWSDFKVLNWTITWINVALSIYAGWLLLTSFKPFSVRFYIAALWLVGPTTLLLSYLASLATLGGHFISATDITKVLVQTLVTGTFWTLYFTKSKRVKETYYSLPSNQTFGPILQSSSRESATRIKSEPTAYSSLSDRTGRHSKTSNPCYQVEVDEEKLRAEIALARKIRRHRVEETNRKHEEEVAEASPVATGESDHQQHRNPEELCETIQGNVDGVSKDEARENSPMFSPIYDDNDSNTKKKFETLLRFSKESESILSLLAIYPDIHERSRLIEGLIEQSPSEIQRQLERLNQDLISTINISDTNLKNDVLAIIAEVKENTPIRLREAIGIANQLGNSLSTDAFRKEFLLGRSGESSTPRSSQNSLKQILEAIEGSKLSGPQIVQMLNDSGVPTKVSYEKGFGQYSIDFGFLSAQDLSYDELKAHLSKSLATLP